MPDRQYIAYYRVSTEEQGKDGHGLDAQRRAVQSYLRAHGGELTGEYTEIESGKKNNRPELQTAIKACRRGKVTLLIAKLDRLGRNVAFIATLMDSKVEFVCCDNPHANELMIHILAAFAQHERKQISKRTKEGLAAAKAKGVQLGNPRIHEVNQPRQEEADRFALRMIPVIEEIKAAGHTTRRAIADELNRRSIPTAKEGKRWFPNTVQLLLKRIQRLQESESLTSTT